MKRKYVKPIIEDLSGISVCLLAGSMKVTTDNVYSGDSHTGGPGVSGDNGNVGGGDGTDIGARGGSFFDDDYDF